MLRDSRLTRVKRGPTYFIDTNFYEQAYIVKNQNFKIFPQATPLPYKKFSFVKISILFLYNK